MWTAFAASAGGASAGLTGLIFIVVSFRFDPIATSPELRSRAAQAVSVFMTATVLAILITVPQARRALGAEMLAVAAVSGLLLFRLDAVARQTQNTRPSILMMAGLTAFVASVTATGLLLLFGATWGLYLYVPGSLVALVFGALGGWTFLTGTATISETT